MVSSQSDAWYTQTGVPAADVPRGAEPSTAQPRDVTAEVAALAVAAPVVVQASRPGFLEGVDLRTMSCVRIIDSWSGPELDGFELDVVDLHGCT